MENLPKDNFTGVHHGEIFPNRPLRYLTASSIMSDKVHDENDEEMGKIEDIMIDLDSGKINYFIVEFGGFLGIGVKLFAIPYKFLEVNPDKKLFVFKGDKDKLADAPGFDLDHWPDTNFHKEVEYWHFV